MGRELRQITLSLTKHFRTHVNFGIVYLEGVDVVVVLVHLVCGPLLVSVIRVRAISRRTGVDANHCREQLRVCLRSLSVRGIFLFLFCLLRTGDDEVALDRSLGGGEGGGADAVVYSFRVYAGFTNDTILEQELQRFWMTRLDIVLVVLQYELDLAVG